MLIRRDAWDRLGGFDTRLQAVPRRPGLLLAGAGGRLPRPGGHRRRPVSPRAFRAAAAGAPRAAHRAPLGPAQRAVRARRQPAAAVHAVGRDRLRRAGRWFGPAYFLVTKQLDQAADQMLRARRPDRAPAAAVEGTPPPRPGRARGYDAVRTFIPPGRTMRQALRAHHGAASPAAPPQATTAGRTRRARSSEEDEQFVDAAVAARRVMASPGSSYSPALLVITLVAERRLLGTSPLGGGALVPAWGGASGAVGRSTWRASTR